MTNYFFQFEYETWNLCLTQDHRPDLWFLYGHSIDSASPLEMMSAKILSPTAFRAGTACYMLADNIFAHKPVNPDAQAVRVDSTHILLVTSHKGFIMLVLVVVQDGIADQVWSITTETPASCLKAVSLLPEPDTVTA